MKDILSHIKISKATIAPILLVIITAILTLMYYMNTDDDQLWLSPLTLVLSIAWMIERFHAVWLKHKLHKVSEVANG
jgi:hypothetical protein